MVGELFSDVGRVYSAVDQLSVDHLRLGYGFGLEAHDVGGHFLVEGAIAASLDGDVTLTLFPIVMSQPLNAWPDQLGARSKM